MIELDGTMGEGGGQILRSSLALSLMTGKPFHLRHIRARRGTPGLRPQHLAGVRAASHISNATVRGDAIGSTELWFEPGTVRAGHYRFAIGTAGATSLLLHVLYLPLALNPAGVASELILEGGTHVSTSPCWDFLNVTWRAHLHQLGLPLSVEMIQPGFYPRGGGQVRVEIPAVTRLRSLSLTQQPDTRTALGLSAIAGLPEHVQTRQARQLTKRLKREKIHVEVAPREWSGGPASMAAVCFAQAQVPPFFFSLGERGKPAERVADEAADAAIAFSRSGAAVDEHSADQIVLPLALADGESVFTTAAVTRHLTTHIEVITRFVSRTIECDGTEGQPGTVRVRAGVDHAEKPPA